MDTPVPMTPPFSTKNRKQYQEMCDMNPQELMIQPQPDKAKTSVYILWDKVCIASLFVCQSDSWFE